MVNETSGKPLLWRPSAARRHVQEGSRALAALTCCLHDVCIWERNSGHPGRALGVVAVRC